MKKDFVRQVVVFENHFKEFRKTPVEQLDMAEALMKKYFDLKKAQKNG